MDVDLNQLCVPLAVVGLSVTGTVPALIYEISIGHLTPGGALPDKVWTRQVQPDTKEADIPPRAWPLVSKAPPWPEVSDWVVEMIGHRPVVFRDPAAYQVLRTHLPDQEFASVLHALNIGLEAFPALYGGSAVIAAGSASQVFGMCGLINAVLVHAELIEPPAGPSPERPTQQT